MTNPNFEPAPKTAMNILKKTGLVFLLLLPLLPILNAGYHADDYVHGVVLERPWGEVIANVFSAHVYNPEKKDMHYRPLNFLTLALGHKSHSPFFSHLISIVIHTISAFFLYLLLKTLTGKSRSALLGALFFLYNPGSIMAVYWFAAVNDLLAVMFLLLSFYLYLHHSSQQSKQVFSCLIYACALLSKEFALVFPALLVIWEIVNRTLVKNWRRIFLFGCVALLYFTIRTILLGHFLMGESDTVLFSVSLSRIAGPAKFLYSLISPLPFFIVYRYPYTILCLLLLIIPAAYYAYTMEKKRTLLSSIAFLAAFILSITPVAGLFVPYYAYFPGIIIAIVFGLITRGCITTRLIYPLIAFVCLQAVSCFYTGNLFVKGSRFQENIVQKICETGEDSLYVVGMPISAYWTVPLLTYPDAISDASKLLCNKEVTVQYAGSIITDSLPSNAGLKKIAHGDTLVIHLNPARQQYFRDDAFVTDYPCCHTELTGANKTGKPVHANVSCCDDWPVFVVQ